MRDHALEYRMLGLPVFPTCTPAWGAHQHIDPETKQPKACPRDSWGKIAMVRWRGYQKNLPSEETIRGWWRTWPDANIAMATGSLSGIVVLDADGTEARKECLKRGGLDQTRAVWTGKVGGCHFHLKMPAEDVRNFVRRIPGTDFRGSGGYVLLPPSLHSSGARYRWVEGTATLTPALVPDWLMELLRGGSAEQGDGESGERLDLREILEGVGEGKRDTLLFSFAGKLRADNVPLMYAEFMVRQAARACRPPFDEDLAAEKVRRAYHEYEPITELEFEDGLPVGQAEPPRLRALSPEDLILGAAPTIPWLISAPADESGRVPGGLLAERETVIVGAASGTGKTWLMSDLAIGLVTGGNLFDHFPVARPCRVMLVDEESSLWLLRQRWDLLLKGHGIDPEYFAREWWPNLSIYVDQGFSFDNERTLDALHDAALQFKPDLILFDTLARIHRRSENDNSAIAALFEDKIKPFKRSVGCGLGFAHHVRKASKDAPSDPGSMLRGASDLKGQLDEFWFLRGKARDPRVIFEHDKCRAMQELPSFVLVREGVPGGGVRLIYSEAGMAATAMDQHKEVLLRFLIDEGGQLALKAILAFAKTRAIGERNAKSALSDLLDDGEIDRVKLGKEAFYWASGADG